MVHWKVVEDGLETSAFRLNELAAQSAVSALVGRVGVPLNTCEIET